MTESCSRVPADLAGRCAELFGKAGRHMDETRLLSSLAGIFGELAESRDALAAFPELGALHGTFVEKLDRRDPEGAEDALTLTYAYLHGCDSAYAPEERKALDRAGGYWCHAGGLSPLWRAAPWIGASSRVADYGAGNGLQGLLFQAVYPHVNTTLIELSGPMVERGRLLQRLMGIPESRVRWVHGSVAEVPPEDFDFIYIYRPLRPEGEEGRDFYRWFARRLAASGREVVVFSIADCLRDFLAPPFRSFYDDGQLTCFANRPV